MVTVIASAEERMKKSVTSLKDDLAAVRTGRASAALFDKLRVDYYGEKAPLSQVANISVPEARLIVIQPWDRAMIVEIEKAIRSSELSLNPSNDGKVIRISIPPLTEERRKDLVKRARALAEASRVAVRNIRRDCNDELKKALKDGHLTEDDEVRSSEELQKLTDGCIKEINRILDEKEKEILEI